MPFCIRELSILDFGILWCLVTNSLRRYQDMIVFQHTASVALWSKAFMSQKGLTHTGCSSDSTPSKIIPRFKGIELKYEVDCICVYI